MDNNDKKIISAFNDLTKGIEELTKCLKEKKKEKSGDGVLNKINLGETIGKITESLKDIKKDTQKILKNQETLLKISKEKSDNKSSLFEKVGEKTKKIKDGVSTIVLIAGGVLAIGLAFKLIGQVDLLSVITLSIAIPIIAYTFQKLSEMRGLKGNELKSLMLTVVAMATTVVVASWIMSKISSVSITQGLTAVLISGVFIIVAEGLSRIISSVKTVKVADIIKMPIVLTTMAISIALASIAMQFIMPITINQGLTAILIAGTFVAISYGIEKIGKGIKNVRLIDIVKIPLVLPALALALALASIPMQYIKPISFAQGMTAILISATFVALSYGLDKLNKGVEKISFKNALLMTLILPALAVAIALSSKVLQYIVPVKFEQLMTGIGVAATLVVMSLAMPFLSKAVEKTSLAKAYLMVGILPLLAAAIWLSSIPLSKTTTIDSGLLLNVVFQSIALGVATVILGAAIWALNELKVDISKAAQGGIIIAILAGTIALSSQILALGKYDKGGYPDLDWTIGVGASLVAFGLATFLLGVEVDTGIGAVALVSGAAAVLVLAGTIVATSFILSKGNYGNSPSLDWSESVALSLASFGVGTMALGAMIVGSLGAGLLVLTAGASGILIIAQSIVDASIILQKGNYSGGPTKEWADGISTALGAFSPIFKILYDRGILGIFSKGPKIEDFTGENGIIIGICKAITVAANYFNDPKNGGSDIFKGGPTAEWSAGISGALSAFAPIFEYLNKNSGWFKTPSDDLKLAITGIASAIVETANQLKDGNYTNSIPDGYMHSLSDNIKIYVDLINYLKNNDITPLSFINTSGISYGLAKLAKNYDELSKSITKLGTSISSLDVDKLDSLQSLSGNMILMSLMDPGQLENIMDTFEAKAGIFVKVMEVLQDNAEKSNKNNISGGSSVSVKQASASVDNSANMLTVLGSIDSKLGTLVKQGAGFSNYLDEIRTHSNNIKKTKHI